MDVLFGPTTRSQSLELCGIGAGNADNCIELHFGLCLEKQGNGDYGEGLILGAPGFDLRAPKRANGRVHNRFQLLARLGIGENAARQKVAAQPALAVHERRAEKALDFRKGRLARLDDRSSKLVGINYWNSTGTQQRRTDRFAHANAARKPEGFHARQGDCWTAR